MLAAPARLDQKPMVLQTCGDPPAGSVPSLLFGCQSSGFAFVRHVAKDRLKHVNSHKSSASPSWN